MSVQKIIFFNISGLGNYIQKDYGKVIKMTPFCHKMYHIKTTLLNTKIFCEQLKPFLLRSPTKNKKVTHFDSKLAFLRELLFNGNQSEKGFVYHFN